MRSIWLLAILLLAGCGRGERQAGAASSKEAVSTDDGRIDCATGGAPDFVHACTVERHGPVLILESPSGGFRRLRLLPGGGVGAADGAERARTVALTGDRVEIAIGGDRFRLAQSALR